MMDIIEWNRIKLSKAILLNLKPLNLKEREKNFVLIAALTAG